jgi:hypothetical protein
MTLKWALLSAALISAQAIAAGLDSMSNLMGEIRGGEG